MSNRELYKQLSILHNDPIIERKTCPVSWEEFAIFTKDREFLDKISPTFAGQAFQIPNPTLSPHERQRRRLIQRNERNYYKSICALSGKPIITTYDPKSGEPVYDTKLRRGDGRDAVNYGQDRKSDESFFQQFHRLRKQVPKIAMMNDNSVGSTNCEYTYDYSYGKDSYMTVESIYSEKCYYSTDVCSDNNVIDCTTMYYSDYCVECTDSYKLHNCIYVQNSESCSDVFFARDCQGCHHCIACTGLRNQSYCIFNQQYSKEEYLEKEKEFRQKLVINRSWLIKERQDFLLQQPRLYANLVNADGCSGNNLFDCTEMHHCFDMKNSRNCRYFFLSADAKDSMDITISCPKGRCYEGVTPDFGRKVCFSTFCRWSENVRYSEMCHRCKDCFWCIGLKDKKHYIFNKQYNPEEYEKKVAEIIKYMIETNERGEYFPYWTSSYAYNKSDAQSRYPLTYEQAIARWYNRDDTTIHINIPENAVTINAQDIIVDPKQCNDDIVDKVLICKKSGKPYRIIKPELELYRKTNMILPQLHQDIRHQERMSRRLGRRLSLRTCPISGESLITPYDASFSGQVLNKKSYEQKIYG